MLSGLIAILFFSHIVYQDYYGLCCKTLSLQLCPYDAISLTNGSQKYHLLYLSVNLSQFIYSLFVSQTVLNNIFGNKTVGVIQLKNQTAVLYIGLIWCENIPCVAAL